MSTNKRGAMPDPDYSEGVPRSVANARWAIGNAGRGMNKVPAFCSTICTICEQAGRDVPVGSPCNPLHGGCPGVHVPILDDESDALLPLLSAESPCDGVIHAVRPTDRNAVCGASKFRIVARGPFQDSSNLACRECTSRLRDEPPTALPRDFQLERVKPEPSTGGAREEAETARVRLINLGARIARGELHPSHCWEDYRKGTGRHEFAEEAGRYARMARAKVPLLTHAADQITALLAELDEARRAREDERGWNARWKEDFDRIGKALDRVREKRPSGEPARSDGAEVEALVAELGEAKADLERERARSKRMRVAVGRALPVLRSARSDYDCEALSALDEVISECAALSGEEDADGE